MKRVLPLILLALAQFALAPAPAQAYAPAALVRSEPADGAVVASAPSQIRIWFNQPVWLQSSDLRLETSAGALVAVGALQLQSYQPQLEQSAAYAPNYVYLCSLGSATLPTLLVLELPALAPASYKLSWSATAAMTRQTAQGALVFGIDARATASTSAATVTQASRDLLIETTVKPNIPGHNFIDLTIANTRRPAPAPISGVALRLTSPAQQRTTISARALDASHFQIAGDALNQAGVWQMTLTIKRNGLPDTTLDLPWTVGDPLAVTPALAAPSARSFSPLARAGGWLALGAVLGTLFFYRRRIS